MGKVKERITHAQWKRTSDTVVDFHTFVLHVHREIEVLAEFDQLSAQQYSVSLLDIEAQFLRLKFASPNPGLSALACPGLADQTNADGLCTRSHGEWQMAEKNSHYLSHSNMSKVPSSNTTRDDIEPSLASKKGGRTSAIRESGKVYQPTLNKRFQHLKELGVDQVLPFRDKACTGSQHPVNMLRWQLDQQPIAHAKARRVKKRTNEAEQTCLICHAAETPEWRQGPNGPRTLCNACGLSYAKRRQKQVDGTKSKASAETFSEHLQPKRLEPVQEKDLDLMGFTSSTSRRFSL